MILCKHRSLAYPFDDVTGSSDGSQVDISGVPTVNTLRQLSVSIGSSSVRIRSTISIIKTNFT